MVTNKIHSTRLDMNSSLLYMGRLVEVYLEGEGKVKTLKYVITHNGILKH